MPEGVNFYIEHADMNEADKFTPSDPKFPGIYVKLEGENGNAFSILARTDEALRRAKCAPETRSAYRAWAMDGDYTHLLFVTMCTVNTNWEEAFLDDGDYDDE